MIKILKVLSKRLLQWFIWLWHQKGTPGQRARGIAAGVFSGCFPFFGLQSLMGIALASFLRGNHLLAAAATWISNPLTYLPLYWFNYQVGCSFLHCKKTSLQLSHGQYDAIWEQGFNITSRLLIGSTLVGAIAALITGSLTYYILVKAKFKKLKLNRSKRKGK